MKQVKYVRTYKKSSTKKKAPLVKPKKQIISKKNKKKKSSSSYFIKPIPIKKDNIFQSENLINTGINEELHLDAMKTNIGIDNQIKTSVDVLKEEEIEDINENLKQVSMDHYDSDCSCDEDKEHIEKVQIFGTDGKHIIPILTDSKGRLIISGEFVVTPFLFKEVIINNLTTANLFQYASSFDVAKNIATSFIVRNRSTVNKVTVQLQDSPDNIHFQIDLPEMEIEPKGFRILTPTRFVRYLRIAYRSTQLNHSATIDVYYQAQSFGNE